MDPPRNGQHDPTFSGGANQSPLADCQADEWRQDYQSTQSVDRRPLERRKEESDHLPENSNLDDVFRLLCTVLYGAMLGTATSRPRRTTPSHQSSCTPSKGKRTLAKKGRTPANRNLSGQKSNPSTPSTPLAMVPASLPVDVSARYVFVFGYMLSMTVPGCISPNGLNLSMPLYVQRVVDIHGKIFQATDSVIQLVALGYRLVFNDNNDTPIKLGEGSFGTVYLLEDASSSRFDNNTMFNVHDDIDDMDTFDDGGILEDDAGPHDHDAGVLGNETHTLDDEMSKSQDSVMLTGHSGMIGDKRDTETEDDDVMPYFALKVLKSDGNYDRLCQDLTGEAQLQEMTDHPGTVKGIASCIVPYYAWVISSFVDGRSKEEKDGGMLATGNHYEKWSESHNPRADQSFDADKFARQALAAMSQQLDQPSRYQTE